MSANAFIENLLVQGLQTRWLLVGEDFRFGHKRSGDIDLRPARQAGRAARYGISQVVVERFNSRLAEMSANAFIENLLVQGLQTRWLLVGEDFRFGHKRSGDIDLLREACGTASRCRTLADVTDQHGHRISSSEVRTALVVGTWTRAPSAGPPVPYQRARDPRPEAGPHAGLSHDEPARGARCAARRAFTWSRSTAWATAPAGRGQPGVRPTVEDHGRVLLRPTCSTRPSMLTVNSCESNSCTSCGRRKISRSPS